MRGGRDYAVITAGYWAFTLTDGALRMLVLLFLHELGRTPLEIASLFLFYEFFGIVTNWFGGRLGSRYGLKSTLVAGLALQVGALAWLAESAAALTVATVIGAQAVSGVAKDLTKMSAKSYVKRLVPDGDAHGLMRWIAVLTGSKNTLKGAGFFLGGALLGALGFRGACLAMAAGLVLTLLLCAAVLPRAAGSMSAASRPTRFLSGDPRINWLSAARCFLFGSRDVWFVLALPVFLSQVLGMSHAAVGGALAAWVIGYGVVQAAAPRWLRAHQGRADARALGRWNLALVPVLAALLGAILGGAPAGPSLVVGLAAFGLVFATNSALSSYLVVAYADSGAVAREVGFYYMANAAGRFVGTILSGALYQWAGGGADGLAACLIGSLVMVFASAACSVPLVAAESRLAADRRAAAP